MRKFSLLNPSLDFSFYQYLKVNAPVILESINLDLLWLLLVHLSEAKNF